MASPDRLLQDMIEVLDSNDATIENRFQAAVALAADLGSICRTRDEFLQLLARSYDLAQAADDELPVHQSGIRLIRPKHG